MRSLDDRRRMDAVRRWPGVMASVLGPDWEVIEEGHPGRTTVHSDPVEGPHKNGALVLPALLETHRPLDLVIIMLGTNDLKARFSVTAFDIASAAEKLVAIIRTNMCGRDGGAPDLLVVSPPPILETGCLAEMFAGGAEKSGRLGEHLRAMAGRNGCGFIDAGAHIRSSEVDGIHLEEEAHRTLGEAIAAEIA